MKRSRLFLPRNLFRDKIDNSESSEVRGLAYAEATARQAVIERESQVSLDEFRTGVDVDLTPAYAEATARQAVMCD